MRSYTHASDDDADSHLADSLKERSALLSGGPLYLKTTRLNDLYQ